MKIHQIPEGTRFIYEGEEYVKSGPMFATGKQGRRLIPKHAVLQSLDQAVAAGALPKADRMSRTAVINAFERFCSDCRGLVPEERRPLLDAARAHFLAALAAND